jgi:hypothetical protein
VATSVRKTRRKTRTGTNTADERSGEFRDEVTTIEHARHLRRLDEGARPRTNDSLTLDAIPPAYSPPIAALLECLTLALSDLWRPPTEKTRGKSGDMMPIHRSAYFCCAAIDAVRMFPSRKNSHRPGVHCVQDALHSPSTTSTAGPKLHLPADRKICRHTSDAGHEGLESPERKNLLLRHPPVLLSRSGSSNCAPGPSFDSLSQGLRSGQTPSERQPHPMQLSS